jgi:hypothetical protein
MIIQRVYRGWIARQLAHALRKERIKRFRNAIMNTWDQVSNNMVDFSMTLFRR